MACPLPRPRPVGTTSLSGQLAPRSAVQWSADNKIAITTDDGIHVLIPQVRTMDNPAILTFHRQFLPAPKQVVKFDVDVDREDFHEDLDRAPLLSLMMDRTLSPLIASSLTSTAYKLCSWSPRIESMNHRCLLATLTVDHRLRLHNPSSRSIARVADLSEKLHRYVKDRKYTDCGTGASEPLDKSRKLYERMKQRTYALAATEMVWTDQFVRQSDDKHSSKRPSIHLLFTAMKDGHLVVWNVTCYSQKDVRIETLSLFHSGFDVISCLTWSQRDAQSGMLAVGGRQGQIKIIRTELIFEGDVVVLHKVELPVWENGDRLAVTQLLLKQNSTNEYSLIACKGCYMLFFDLVEEQGKLAIRRRAECVGSSISFATGLIESHGFFWTSYADGSLRRFRVETAQNELHLDVQTVPLDNQGVRRSLMGIDQSPSGIMFCIVTRLSTYFDHLKIREPIEVAVFVLDSMAQAASMLKPGTVLNDVQDVLLYVRMMVGQGEPLPDELSRLASASVDALRSESFRTLQFAWWLFNVLTANITAEHEETAQLIDSLIMKQRLLKNLRTLIERGCETWSSQMVAAIHGARDALQNVFELDEDERALVDEASFLAKGEAAPEECPICGESTPVESIKAVTCPNAHSFARCCLTLQAVCVDYLKCVHCGALALPVEWLRSERCSFCDGELS